MKNTEYNITAKALETALNYAGIRSDEARCLYVSCFDGFVELVVHTPYQKYEFYVDVESEEVVGINAEPALDFDQVYEDEPETGVIAFAPGKPPRAA